MNTRTWLLLCGLSTSGCAPYSPATPQDARSSQLTGTNWRLYSVDAVYFSGNAYSYIQRSTQDSCSVRVHFENPGSFSQDTLCGGVVSVSEYGSWFWPLHDSLELHLGSDSLTDNARMFFRFTGDTLQFLFTYREPKDSLNGQPLRLIQTFIPVP